MTRSEVAVRYAAIPASFKARFLVALAHELTIRVREFYLIQDSVDTLAYKHLIGTNERNHHLNSEAANHLDSDEKRYPDDVLILILFEIADQYSLTTQFASALQQTIRRFAA